MSIVELRPWPINIVPKPMARKMMERIKQMFFNFICNQRLESTQTCGFMPTLLPSFNLF
jgi:hypothetical protein